MTKKEGAYVNGPINTIRLEGEVDGIKKIVYLLMDYHIETPEQTECVQDDNIDLHQYLRKTFKDTKDSGVNYDFFFEISPTEFKRPVSLYKEKYIEQVVKWFKREFNFDPKKNIVFNSKSYPHVRLHYIDIRGYLHGYGYSSLSELNNGANHMLCNMGSFTGKNMKRVENLIKQLLEHMLFTEKILFGNLPKINKKDGVILTSSKKVDKKFIQEKSIKFAKKIRYKYKNKNVQKKINSFLEKDIRPDIKKVINRSNEILKKYIKGDTELSEIKKYWLFENFYGRHKYGVPYPQKQEIIWSYVHWTNEMFNSFMTSFVRLMDLYFLRRLLDKKYVTNAIVYTGAYHSDNYVYYLVKYFNFKITHVSYSNPKDLSKLNKKIKELDSSAKITPLTWTYELYQCSDLSSFPENFL